MQSMQYETFKCNTTQKLADSPSTQIYYMKIKQALQFNSKILLAYQLTEIDFFLVFNDFTCKSF